VTCGRVGTVAVSLDRVESIDVTKATKEADVADETIYAPTVRWRSAKGALTEGKLAEWSEKEKAEQLAAWLRARLCLKAPSGAG
jgi:hypothetical protein